MKDLNEELRNIIAFFAEYESMSNKHGYDLYLLSDFPQSLEKYKNNFIWVKNNLHFIKRDVTAEMVKINDPDKIALFLKNIDLEKTEKISLSEQQVNQLILQNGAASYTYVNLAPFDDRKRQQLEAYLIMFFSQYLSQEGAEIANIDKFQRKLRLVFHTDKYSAWSPEIRWLEYILSDGKFDGACFKLVDLCANELKDPFHDSSDDTEENMASKEAKDINEYIRNLRKQRSAAQTLTQKALLDSILAMLHSMKNHHNTSARAKECNGWLAILMHSTPYITSSFCMGLYIKELALLFAVTYAISTGGGWLENSSLGFLKLVGREMKVFSNAISCAAMTLMAYLIKINFAAANTAYYIGIQTCSTIYKRLLSSTSTQSTNYMPKSSSSSSSSSSSRTPNYNNDSCMTLSLAPQDLLGGRHFQNLEIKLMTLSLERWQALQKKQLFASLRQGQKKDLIISNAFNDFISIDDKLFLDKQAMLAAAGKVLEKLANNPRVNVPGSHAGIAITMSKNVYKSFYTNEEEEPQALAYNGESLF